VAGRLLCRIENQASIIRRKSAPEPGKPSISLEVKPPQLEQPANVLQSFAFAEAASPEQPQEARRISGIRRSQTEPVFEIRVVRLGVGTELAARTEELDAEFVVAFEMLPFQARALGGEAVGPAQNREFLSEGTGGAGEPTGRVVGAVIGHEAYLQVERGEGRHEVR